MKLLCRMYRHLNVVPSTPVNRTRFVPVNNVRLARLLGERDRLVCGW